MNLLSCAFILTPSSGALILRPHVAPRQILFRQKVPASFSDMRCISEKEAGTFWRGPFGRVEVMRAAMGWAYDRRMSLLWRVFDTN